MRRVKSFFIADIEGLAVGDGPQPTAEFAFMLENINTTKGNLSFQLSKLKEAGYIDIEKSFKGSYPHTTCRITQTGINAYKKYVDNISEYFQNFNEF